MEIHVHLSRTPTENDLDLLKMSLSSDVLLSVGVTMPERTQVLVSGRPSKEELSSPHLETLIIPWAGLPVETGKRLSDIPHISVHNLHHGVVPVAETAVMLLMAAAKNTIAYDQTLRRNDWTLRYHPKIDPFLLQGSTAFILGYGAIGKYTAKLCMGLGMKVVATRQRLIVPTIEDNVQIYPADSLNELLPKIDALMISIPYTMATEGLVGETELKLMKKTSVLVNISRGPVVDEAALYRALKEKYIAAAGIDVWYNYPPDEESRKNTPPSQYPFHELDNVVLSPHRAGRSHKTEKLRMVALAKLLNASAAGEIIPNKVDIKLGY